MKIVMTVMRAKAKLVSELVLLMILIWSVVPAKGHAHTCHKHQLFKSSGEQILTSLDLSKSNTLNSATKDGNCTIESGRLSLHDSFADHYLKSFLQVTAFTYNTFYVNLTINAP